MKKNGAIVIANCADGTHDGNCTFIAVEPLTERYLLVTMDGTVGNGKVKPCGEGELPIGVATDEAEANDAVNVHFLGGSETIIAVAAAPISAGTIVAPAENGKVSAPESEGDHYLIGIAVGSAASAGDRIEILPNVPPALTIEE
ncbi:MAG: DUF2190 family protein [Puniceicoccales bacterium]|jgi:hypothetical protein|nr:DUF2190 family protein [Puniceicoccales bacterium]